MKRKALLIVAATASAAVLGLTQLSNAANPAKDPSTAATPTEESAKPGHGPKDRGPGRDGFRGPHGPRGDKMGFERRKGEGRGPFGADLNLTAEQKAKVKSVMEASRPKIEAIRAEERAKIQAVLDEAQSQIRPVLTPAQQQVLDDSKKLRESMQKLRQDAAALKKSE